MGELTERTGDLFITTAKALAHGVNTEGLMGAGIAVRFKHAYPLMYEVYKEQCRDGKLAPGGVMAWLGLDQQIYNIASQDKPGPNARLEWFEQGFRTTLDLIVDNKLSTALAIPRIGCGIGGLNWVDVRDIVEHYTTRSSIDVEVWTLEKTE